jgi:hypothetical protein
MNSLLNVMENSALDVKLCLHCKVPVTKITSFQNKLMTTVYKADETSE